MKKTDEEIKNIINNLSKKDKLNSIRNRDTDYYARFGNLEDKSYIFFEYNEDSKFITCFHSELAFDNFFNIFNAPYLDFNMLNKQISEIQFLHVFSTGVQLNKNINSIEDLKYYFQYDGTNYRYKFEIDDDDTLSIDIDYILNLDSEKFELDIYFNYCNENLDIDVSYNSFSELRTFILQCISKALSKNLTDLKMKDSEIIQIITY